MEKDNRSLLIGSRAEGSVSPDAKPQCHILYKNSLHAASAKQHLYIILVRAIIVGQCNQCGQLVGIHQKKKKNHRSRHHRIGELIQGLKKSHTCSAPSPAGCGDTTRLNQASFYTPCRHVPPFLSREVPAIGSIDNFSNPSPALLPGQAFVCA